MFYFVAFAGNQLALTLPIIAWSAWGYRFPNLKAIFMAAIPNPDQQQQILFSNREMLLHRPTGLLEQVGLPVVEFKTGNQMMICPWAACTVPDAPIAVLMSLQNAVIKSANWVISVHFPYNIKVFTGVAGVLTEIIHYYVQNHRMLTNLQLYCNNIENLLISA